MSDRKLYFSHQYHQTISNFHNELLYPNEIYDVLFIYDENLAYRSKVSFTHSSSVSAEIYKNEESPYQPAASTHLDNNCNSDYGLAV